MIHSRYKSATSPVSRTLPLNVPFFLYLALSDKCFSTSSTNRPRSAYTRHSSNQYGLNSGVTVIHVVVIIPALSAATLLYGGGASAATCGTSPGSSSLDSCQEIMNRTQPLVSIGLTGVDVSEEPPIETEVVQVTWLWSRGFLLPIMYLTNKPFKIKKDHKKKST